MLRQGRAASKTWCTDVFTSAYPQHVHDVSPQHPPLSCSASEDCTVRYQQVKQLPALDVAAMVSRTANCRQIDSEQKQARGCSMVDTGLSCASVSCTRSRGVRTYLWSEVLLPWILVLSLAGLFQSASSITDAVDKAALLAFKSNITNDGGLLQTWSPSTDPCGDPSGLPWTGITCTCNGSIPGDYDLLCGHAPAPSTSNGSRVLSINFGDIIVSGGRKLTGGISQQLDNLSQLRLLNLRQNYLSVCWVVPRLIHLDHASCEWMRDLLHQQIARHCQVQSGSCDLRALHATRTVILCLNPSPGYISVILGIDTCRQSYCQHGPSQALWACLTSSGRPVWVHHFYVLASAICKRLARFIVVLWALWLPPGPARQVGGQGGCGGVGMKRNF